MADTVDFEARLQRPATHDAAMARAFMTEWKPTHVRDRPWALEQFGEPRCPLSAAAFYTLQTATSWHLA